MDSTVVVAIIGLVASLGGSLIVSFSAVSKSNVELKTELVEIKGDVKALRREIETLSIRVDKHNGFAERMPVLEERQAVANHRIEDIEQQLNR